VLAERNPDLVEARAAADRAVWLAPLDAGSHMAVGMVAAKDARTEEATTSYQRALALEPDNWVAHNELARLTPQGVGSTRAASPEQQVGTPARFARTRGQRRAAATLMPSYKFLDPGGPAFKLRTAITGALSAGGRPQTHPAIVAVDVSSMLNHPKAPAESLLPGDSLTIPATQLATDDERKRPSPNGKGPLTCNDVGSGGRI
jgi:hypothetical protein